VEQESMKFIDLFAGVGGFRYGLETLNKRRFRKTTYPRDGLSDIGSGNKRRRGNKQQTFSCVYSNEWDKYANNVYRKHYGECDQTDIRKVNAADIPDHDLLCGGVPCQAWSIAGKRKGFEDSRGTMWYECFRIIQAKKPKYLLLENVKGILSHNGGKSFEQICECICELGYAIDFEVLNSKNFGVPQNRERVFIVGIRLDLLDKCQIF